MRKKSTHFHEIMASWSDYCNQLVGDGSTIVAAGVLSPQGQAMGYSAKMYEEAAKDAAYDYAAEGRNLVAALANPSLAQASGIKAGGVKYMFIRSHVQEGVSDAFLAGNKAGAGISVRQTKAVILIAVSAPGKAVQCDMTLAKAATGLIAAGS
jgi:hypothetical protein